MQYISKRAVRGAVLAAAFAGLPACDDERMLPHAGSVTEPTPPSLVVETAQDVPSRKSDPRYTFIHMSDDSLWHRIASGDSTALVGLKAPGANRGFFKGRNLVAAEEKSDGVQALSSHPGVEMIDQADDLPILKVKLRDKNSLNTLRRMPFIDYIEPAVLRNGFQGTTFGCSTDPWSGPTAYSVSGDVLPAIYRWMHINDAWNRSSGRGVQIGLTDTGLFQSSHQILSFNTGESSPRGYSVGSTNGSSGWISDTGCSHGTRMAGIMAAPRDGIGPIGVAWGADLYSVRHQDDVAVFDVWSAKEAIRMTAQVSQIITMAWGTSNDWFNSIESEIEYWHHTHGRLFVGAAGTVTTCADVTFRGWWKSRGVIFPARMEEVLAVTAVDPQGEVACDVHAGPEVDLVAYYNYPTAGRNREVLGMRGSSSATAAIAGAAALVWSRYGTNNKDVRRRLIEAASYYPNTDPEGARGYGLINVMKALGGMYNTTINTCGGTNCTFSYKLAQCEYKSLYASPVGGTGPYSYQWSNGGTSSSTSIRLCPEPYKTATYAVSVTVRDQSDGTAISKTASLNVTHSNPDYACPTCPL